VKAERATASVRSLEQLANCTVRQAAAVAKATPPDPKRAATLLDEAEALIRHLLDVGKTSERYSLLGGTHKRRARLAATRDDMRAAIEQMREAYASADALAREAGAVDPYPLANLVGAEIVLGWSGQGKAERVAAARTLLADLAEAARSARATRTDPFNLSASADQLLLEALANRTLGESQMGAIQQRLDAALSRGSSQRVRDSMRSQLDFFLDVLALYPAHGREAVRSALEQLRERVRP
jgi:hypothetical protein